MTLSLKYKASRQQRFCVMRAAWFIGKIELLLNCTKYPNYSPKSRTPQQPQHVVRNPLKIRISKLEANDQKQLHSLKFDLLIETALTLTVHNQCKFHSQTKTLELVDRI